MFDMALGSFMVLRMEGEGIYNIIIPHFVRKDKGDWIKKTRKSPARACPAGAQRRKACAIRTVKTTRNTTDAK